MSSGTQMMSTLRLHAEILVRVFKIKDYPQNDPPPFLCGLSLVLGSS